MTHSEGMQSCEGTDVSLNMCVCTQGLMENSCCCPLTVDLIFYLNKQLYQ